MRYSKALKPSASNSDLNWYHRTMRRWNSSNTAAWQYLHGVWVQVDGRSGTGGWDVPVDGST